MQRLARESACCWLQCTGGREQVASQGGLRGHSGHLTTPPQLHATLPCIPRHSQAQAAPTNTQSNTCQQVRAQGAPLPPPSSTPPHTQRVHLLAEAAAPFGDGATRGRQARGGQGQVQRRRCACMSAEAARNTTRLLPHMALQAGRRARWGRAVESKKHQHVQERRMRTAHTCVATPGAATLMLSRVVDCPDRVYACAQRCSRIRPGTILDVMSGFRADPDPDPGPGALLGPELRTARPHTRSQPTRQLLLACDLARPHTLPPPHRTTPALEKVCVPQATTFAMLQRQAPGKISRADNTNARRRWWYTTRCAPSHTRRFPAGAMHRIVGMGLGNEGSRPARASNVLLLLQMCVCLAARGPHGQASHRAPPPVCSCCVGPGPGFDPQAQSQVRPRLLAEWSRPGPAAALHSQGCRGAPAPAARVPASAAVS